MLARNDVDATALDRRLVPGPEDTHQAASSELARGRLVQVRSAAEILATLDADFTLDGLPFMPEMLKYCGRRMTVYRRANKTCVEGHGLRAMGDTVLLADSHCDGAAHDGCQKHCLIFWKEAWLAPVDEAAAPAVSPAAPVSDATYRSLAAATREGETYRCQSSLLYQATRPLSAFGVAEYVQEFAGGELSAGRFLMIVGRTLANRLRRIFGVGPIAAVVGSPGPHEKGDLNLQPGEYVEVRSADEIGRTVGPSGKNRGLQFEPDMTSFTGGKFEVEFRVDKMIHEETGKMVHLTNTVALKNVHCTGACTKNCPRSQSHFWREAWVKRVSPEA